tara:strand:- start:369 stop:839 length:471 start_codon:yes stop_codon:yes gene_type:complete
MNILQISARIIIKHTFDLSVWSIEAFSVMEPYHDKVSKIRKLENGTVGKAIADSLDNSKMTLIPKYESHDLKHVLLDYNMTEEGEIRLQAFMVGNGNYSITSCGILIFGVVLLPELWSTLLADFKKGKASVPLAEWTIEKYANRNLIELRSEIAYS